MRYYTQHITVQNNGCFLFNNQIVSKPKKNNLHHRWHLPGQGCKTAATGVAGYSWISLVPFHQKNGAGAFAAGSTVRQARPGERNTETQDGRAPCGVRSSSVQAIGLPGPVLRTHLREIDQNKPFPGAVINNNRSEADSYVHCRSVQRGGEDQNTGILQPPATTDQKLF